MVFGKIKNNIVEQAVFVTTWATREEWLRDKRTRTTYRHAERQTGTDANMLASHKTFQHTQ